MYLGGHLPPWWYKVWGSVTTVPLFKTVERETVRPVGVCNPLTRTLHSRVIRENRATLNPFHEAEQRDLSQAGGTSWCTRSGRPWRSTGTGWWPRWM